MSGSTRAKSKARKVSFEFYFVKVNIRFQTLLCKRINREHLFSEWLHHSDKAVTKGQVSGISPGYYERKQKENTVKHKELCSSAVSHLLTAVPNNLKSW